MAVVPIHSDFRAKEEEICHYFHVSPFNLPVGKGVRCHDLCLFVCLFLIFNFKLVLSLSSFTLIKRLFSSSSLSAIRVISPAYMPILIPVCNSSSPTFLMVCSAYRLKKLGDNRQPCHTPLSILNQSVVQHRVLTVVSWPTYRFLREQVIRWSDIRNTLRAFQFVIIHTVKGFSVVDEIEVDVFSGIPLLSLWFSKCWQFYLCFLFFF